MNLSYITNVLDFFTKLPPFCSPFLFQINAPHFTLLAPLFLWLAYLSILSIFQLTHIDHSACQWANNIARTHAHAGIAHISQLGASSGLGLQKQRISNEAKARERTE